MRVALDEEIPHCTEENGCRDGGVYGNRRTVWDKYSDFSFSKAISKISSRAAYIAIHGLAAGEKVIWGFEVMRRNESLARPPSRINLYASTIVLRLLLPPCSLSHCHFFLTVEKEWARLWCRESRQSLPATIQFQFATHIRIWSRVTSNRMQKWTNSMSDGHKRRRRLIAIIESDRYTLPTDWSHGRHHQWPTIKKKWK